MNVQGCNALQKIKCARVLVECAPVCAFGEIDEPLCILCLGDLYYTCRDCFRRLEATERQAGKLQVVHSLYVAIPNKCSFDVCLFSGNYGIKTVFETISVRQFLPELIWAVSIKCGIKYKTVSTKSGFYQNWYIPGFYQNQHFI